MVHLRDDLEVDVSVGATRGIIGAGGYTCRDTETALTHWDGRLYLRRVVPSAVDLTSSELNLSFRSATRDDSEAGSYSIIANSHVSSLQIVPVQIRIFLVPVHRRVVVIPRSGGNESVDSQRGVVSITV